MMSTPFVRQIAVQKDLNYGAQLELFIHIHNCDIVGFFGEAHRCTAE